MSIEAPTNDPKLAFAKTKGTTVAAAPPGFEVCEVVLVLIPVVDGILNGLLVIVAVLLPVKLVTVAFVVVALVKTTVLLLIKLPEGVGAGEP